MRLFGLLIVLMFSPTALSEEENKIIWYSYQASPAYILEGPDKGKGFVDLVRTQIIDGLPKYQHEHSQVTVGRMLYDMQFGKKVCFPSLIKTKERELFVTFSNFSIMQYSLQLIISKRLAEELALENEVDITDLFVKHNLVAAKMAGRSYTQPFDELFFKLNSQVINLAADSNIELFQLLIKGRIDFILDYPSVASYVLKQQGHEDDFVTIKVKGIDEFIFSSVACSKGPWGDKVIADVNKVLADLRAKPAYFNALTAWLSEEKQGDNFAKVYNAFIQSTNEPFVY